MNNFSLQLYSALLLVSGRLFYLVPDKNIDHHLLPLGCVPNPVTCYKLPEIDNFKGSNYTEIRISHCPDDPSMVYLICIDQVYKECITTSCLPKSKLNNDEQCKALFWNNDSQIHSHSYNVFQEPCSSTEEKIVCCKGNSDESQLLAGYGAEPHEFPHQVLLLTYSSENYLSQCGGTIYNEKWIITAAHCVVQSHPFAEVVNGKYVSNPWYSIPLKPNQVQIVVGTNIGIVADRKNRYKAKRIIVHSGYSKLKENHDLTVPFELVPYTNDIALIEIDGALELGENVKALEIAPEKFSPEYFSDKLLIVGWGDSDNVRTSEYLLKGDLKIQNRSVCSQFESYELKSQLCVGGFVNGVPGLIAGSGDSGGPAICRDGRGMAVLCGVASYGGANHTGCIQDPNEESCLPTVYTDVSHFRKWIISTAGGQKSEKTIFHSPQLYGEEIGHDLFQVKISALGETDCAGTLISSSSVITAAHCLFNSDANEKKNLTIKFRSVVYEIKAMQILSSNGKLKVLNKKFSSAYKEDEISADLFENDYYESDMVIVKLSSEVPEVNPIELSTTELKKDDQVYEAAIMKDSALGNRKYLNLITGKFNCEGRYTRLIRGTYHFKLGDSDVCLVEKYAGGSVCDRKVGGGVFCVSPDGIKLCGVQVFRMCNFSVPKIVAQIFNYVKKIKKFEAQHS